MLLRLADVFGITLDPIVRIRLLTEMARIYTEELPAIPLFFRVNPWVFSSLKSDARHSCELRERLRPSLGDLLERGVVEDDVRRHLVGLCSLEAPLLQRPERGR